MSSLNIAASVTIVIGIIFWIANIVDSGFKDGSKIFFFFLITAALMIVAFGILLFIVSFTLRAVFGI